MPIEMQKWILTVPEAALILNCSQQKIYQLIKANKLDAYKDFCESGRSGRNWKISAFSVVRYQELCLNIYNQKKL